MENEATTLQQLREEAQHCRACELYKHATQVVMGDGPQTAGIVMIGEQPGDREDIEGAPFVGPAGQLLDRALQDAGIARREVYLTNAVKHFKFEQRGRRRIHKKPSTDEVAACHPWLQAELSAVRPELIVCLGATAAHALIGKKHELMKERGKFFEHPLAKAVTATVHPSAILRSPDPEQRAEDFSRFVQDLIAARRKLAEIRRAG